MVLDPTQYAVWADGSETQADVEAMTKRIYASLPDEFDFIIFENNQASLPANAAFYGQYRPVRNDTTGLGQSLFNHTTDFGSAGALQGVIDLTTSDGLLGGPSLHEILHRWANYFPEINGGDPTHWGFSSVGGQLGGFQYGTLQDLGNGTYQASGPGGHSTFGTIANGGNSIPYSPLELYAMGLINATDVTEPIQVAQGAAFVGDSGNTFTASGITTLTIQDLVAAQGERTPTPATSQKSFRALLVVLTPTPLDQTSLDTFDTDVEDFSLAGDDGTGLYNFYEATGGRATITMDNVVYQTPAPTSAPPVKVLGVEWQTRKLSKKQTAKVLVVSFSGALEQAPAQNLADYHLVALGKAKKSGAGASKPVALASAVYDPAMETVTLTPRGTVPKQTLQLTINTVGTLDAEGRPIQGNQGSNVVATFGRSGGVSLANTAGPSAAPRVSAQAFDALLRMGRLPATRLRWRGH
jgi:hypothetical protein